MLCVGLLFLIFSSFFISIRSHSTLDHVPVSLKTAQQQLRLAEKLQAPRYSSYCLIYVILLCLSNTEVSLTNIGVSLTQMNQFPFKTVKTKYVYAS